jgi:sulfite exporter TauE/SafE
MLGFFGGSHCLVMCGGISAALGIGAAPETRQRTVFLFQLGRITSYALLGAGLGALLAAVTTLQTSLLPALRILSGVLLIAMGFYLGNWWSGLLGLERLGGLIWQHIQPLAQRRLPIQNSRDALVVGMLWGFLPCGLIYTALAWSASAADWRQSAALMAVFGLGTTPAMLATGLAAHRLMRLLQMRGFRRAGALLLIAAGAWTAWIGYQHAGHLAQGPDLAPAENRKAGESPAHHEH